MLFYLDIKQNLTNTILHCKGLVVLNCRKTQIIQWIAGELHVSFF